MDTETDAQYKVWTNWAVKFNVKLDTFMQHDAILTLCFSAVYKPAAW